MSPKPFSVPVPASQLALLAEIFQRLVRLDQLGMPVDCPMQPALVEWYLKRLTGSDQTTSQLVAEIHTGAAKLYRCARQMQEALAEDDMDDPERMLDCGYELAKLRGALVRLGNEHQLMLDEGWNRGQKHDQGRDAA